MGDRMNSQEIIAALRRERRLQELSQLAVGVAIDKPQNVIARYETGQHKPGLDTVTAWADTLGYELTLQPKVKP